MKMIKLIAFAVIILFALNIEAQNFGWAKNMGGNPNAAIGIPDNNGVSIETDELGNVYTVGYFSNTVDFDPSPSGVFNLTSTGSRSMFISKLDSMGNFLWARCFDGQYTLGNSFKIDALGNIYITGFFKGLVDFDPGSGVFNLTTNGNNNTFIIKMNSLGDLIWAKKIGESLNIGRSVDLDNNGNIYVTCHFYNTVDFNPNSGVFNLVSLGNADMAILKLDSFGAFVWAKSLGGISNSQGPIMKIDSVGNILLTGSLNGTVDFDPDAGIFNLTSVGANDVFVLKLNTNGNFVWAKNIGDLNQIESYSICTDVSNNVYISGSYSNTIDFDPSNDTYNLTSNGGIDIFMTKLNSDGTFQWAKSIGGAGSDTSNSFKIDASGNIYLAGFFSDTVDFDPSDAGLMNKTATLEDIFISKYDSNGNFSWVYTVGSIGRDIANGLHIDADYNVYLTGYFSKEADFDASFNDVFKLYPNGRNDAFILKLNQDIVSPIMPINMISLCNEIIPSFNTRLYFNQVAGAQQYLFSVTNQGTGVEEIITTTNNYFKLSDLNNYSHNQIYTVKGKVKVNGFYGPFGESCTILSPKRLPNLIGLQCNAVLSSINTKLRSISITGATSYKFLLVNGSTQMELESPIPQIQLLSFFNVQPNTTYQVWVSAKINGAWLEYGNPCTISTPNMPTTRLRNNNCDGYTNNLNKNFNAIAKPFASGYRFRTTINGETIVVEKAESKCNMTEFQIATMNKTYKIDVAIKVNGIWSDYGDACNWTVGTVGTRLIDEEAVANASELFEIKAYPNPFVNQITLALANENTKSDIMVYDMTGKLIQQVSTEETSLEIGNDWSNGVYLVQIVQDQEAKNIRVVKQ